MTATSPPPAEPFEPSTLLSASSRNATSSAIRDLLVHARQPGIISLAGGLPASDMFPVGRLGDIAAATVSDPGALQYGLTEGEDDLRAWVAAHHSHLDGRDWTRDDVQIVSGSQQGLDLVARVLLDPGDVVVVAESEYLGAIGVFRQARAELVPVPIDGHGIDTDILASRLRSGLRPKCCYLIPEFHNPTGNTISRERLDALARLSEQYGFLIIEDNPYGRLRFEGRSVPTIATATANVVQCRTISKTVVPGLRVAWLIGPKWLLNAVRIAKQSADLHTSTISQGLALAIMSDHDWYETHLTNLISHYRLRRDALSEALSDQLPEATFLAPSGGMFLWVTLEDHLDATALLPRALEAGVAFVPGSAFAVTDPVASSMRLSFSTVTPDRLVEGVSRLSEAIRTLAH